VAFGGAVAAALAGLAELGGGGLLGHQRRQLGVGGGDDLAAGREDGGRLDAVALAQLVEQRRAELRCGLELLGHAVGLDRELVEEHLEEARPSCRPLSRAVSTRTLNHDSMLFTANCRDTAYTSTPGTTAIAAKMAIRRSLSREPKRRERYSCHSPRSCTNTRLARPSAMTPLSPSSRV
jgi:hypothetical protein